MSAPVESADSREPVPAHRQEQPGEYEGVGVDDPLELAARSAEITLDRRQRDVEDRVVERDDEE
jgi:hypothetical protein